MKGPAPASPEAITLQCPQCPAAPPCPSPVVNLPLSGWLPLAVLMGVLWMRSLWKFHKREAELEAVGPARAPRAKRVKEESPEPQADEDDPSNYQAGETPVPKQFEQAMKSLGYKGAEIKAAWAKVDPKAPLDAQIVQALK
jgi:hypothetical protein